LEEDDLSALVDPDYPLLAPTVGDESRRSINDVPESLWSELRERLKGEFGRDLFYRAIVSYCDDFQAQIGTLEELGRNPTPEFASLRREAENSRQLCLYNPSNSILCLGGYGRVAILRRIAWYRLAQFAGQRGIANHRLA
jgi:hypothetical protein